MNEYLNEEDFLGAFASEIEEVPPQDRAERIARVRSMWEKYSGDDDVVSFKDLEKLMENEPPAVKVQAIKTFS